MSVAARLPEIIGDHYQSPEILEKKKPRQLGRGFLFERQRLNLTEPLHEFLGFGLGSGQAAIVIAATPFCDTGFDSDSAVLVYEGRHCHSPLLWKFMRGNLGRRRLPAVLTITIFTIIDHNVMPVTGSMWATRFYGIWKPGRHVPTGKFSIQVSACPRQTKPGALLRALPCV